MCSGQTRGLPAAAAAVAAATAAAQLPLTLYRPAAVLPALHFLRDGIAVRLVVKQIVGGRLVARQLCCAHEPDLCAGEGSAQSSAELPCTTSRGDTRR